MRKTRVLAEILQLKRLEQNNSAGITERRASVWARVVKSPRECAAAAAAAAGSVAVCVYADVFLFFHELLAPAAA